MKNTITCLAILLLVTACQSNTNNNRTNNTINKENIDHADATVLPQWKGQYYYATDEVNEERGISYGVEYVISHTEQSCRIMVSGYQIHWRAPCELRATDDVNIVSVYNLDSDNEFAKLKFSNTSYQVNMTHYSEVTDGFEPIEKRGKQHWVFDDVSADNLVSKDALTCSNDGNFDDDIFIYWLFAGNIPQTNFDKQNKTVILSADQRITDVKNFSRTQRGDANAIMTKTHLDVDVHKFGVDVMRISQLSTDGVEYSEYESSGYYLVLKGSPEYNKATLANHGVYVDSELLEKTKAGNTRMTCIVAG